jgi:flagellar biosynthetic protein FliO
VPNGSPRWPEPAGGPGPALTAGLLVALLVVLLCRPALAQEPQGAAPAAASSPAQALPTPEPAEPFDWTAALVDLAWKLVVVVVLAYGVLALLRRYSLVGLPGQRRGALQVQEAITLAPNRALYLVRAGNRRLLLGVTPSQITLLTELAPEESGAPFAAALDAARADAANGRNAPATPASSPTGADRGR